MPMMTMTTTMISISSRLFAVDDRGKERFARRRPRPRSPRPSSTSIHRRRRLGERGRRPRRRLRRRASPAPSRRAKNDHRRGRPHFSRETSTTTIFSPPSPRCVAKPTRFASISREWMDRRRRARAPRIARDPRRARSIESARRERSSRVVVYFYERVPPRADARHGTARVFSSRPVPSRPVSSRNFKFFKDRRMKMK